MEVDMERVSLLISQKRFTEAKELLTQALSANPDDPIVHALHAECLLGLGDAKIAQSAIDAAIGLLPTESSFFYTRARVMMHLAEYDDAEKDLAQAQRLDPADADVYAMWAWVKLNRKQFEDALKLSDKALEIAPDHVLGLNARSKALLKLDRKEESFETIEESLNEDPNNAFTHTNLGWNYLEKGDHEKALEHFREALMLDPNFSYAQAGMMEALKAKYLIYRWFLKYTFWMQNFSAKYQWGIILGFYFGTKYLQKLAHHNEALRPFLMPIVILLSIVAFSTWIISPLTNLLMRFNPYGKHLLDKEEKRSSNFVAGSAAVSILGLIGWIATGGDPWLAMAVFGLGMMVPFAMMFLPAKIKHSFLIYTCAMFLIGTVGVVTSFQTGELLTSYATWFLLMFVGFQFFANFVAIKQDNL